jgi:antirestriction protein
METVKEKKKSEGFGAFKPLTKYGVYFANLSAYVSGRLVGKWVYPLRYGSFEDFAEAIKEATKDGTEYADEVAVHDYDNFPNMGEYPDHESIYNLAHAIDESYIDDEVLIKYFKDYYSSNIEELADCISDIENAYIGIYDNFREFADDRADEAIECIVNKDAQQFVFSNFDYEGYAKDLEHDFRFIQLDNYDVAIFNPS